MDIRNNKELVIMLDSIQKNMIDYMQGSHVGYTAETVTKCRFILEEHLSCIESSSSQEAYLAEVKKTVESLNELNEMSDYDLIETDEREQICEVIITAGFLLGFNDAKEDVTEAWREF